MDTTRYDTLARELGEIGTIVKGRMSSAPRPVKKRMKNEMKTGVSPFMPLVILGLLNKGELYGYQIMSLASLAHGKKRLTASKVYPLLHRMEEEGAIKSAWSGRRRIYHITPDGKKKLTWCKETLKLSVSVTARIIRVLFDEEVKL